jgi:TIR domain
MTEKPYDVALSFFAKDVAFARDLYERLRQELSVFFFERAQEEVTGSDGDEKFRKPFREARLSVVLLRPGYGERGWTGVEKVAIVETCVQRSYKNLFVVRMEDMPTPGWIPETNIYFDIETFPVEQLIAAIKMKVVELGGRPEPMTAERRAVLHVENQKFEAERKEFRSGTASFQKFVAEIAILFMQIEAKCNALIAKGIKIEINHNSGQCVIRNATVSMAVYCRFSGYGRIEHETLTVEEYEARIEMPYEQVWWPEGRPRATNTERYELELTHSRTLAWKPHLGTDLWSSEVMADKIVVRFLELADEVTFERNRKRF